MRRSSFGGRSSSDLAPLLAAIHLHYLGCLFFITRLRLRLRLSARLGSARRVCWREKSPALRKSGAGEAPPTGRAGRTRRERAALPALPARANYLQASAPEAAAALRARSAQFPAEQMVSVGPARLFASLRAPASCALTCIGGTF